MMFEAVWQRLTLAQRAVLRAVVLEDGRRAAVGRRARRAIASAARRPCRPRSARCVREDVIARDGDRYAVVDSLLREWVARQTF